MDGRARVSERAAPLSWARGPGLGVVLVAVVTAVGTAGYVVIEGWSVWDAFFMTIISVTTVGYGYVRARWLPEQGAGWQDTAHLIEQIAALAREPQVRPAPDDHVH